MLAYIVGRHECGVGVLKEVREVFAHLTFDDFNGIQFVAGDADFVVTCELVVTGKLAQGDEDAEGWSWRWLARSCVGRSRLA